LTLRTNIIMTNASIYHSVFVFLDGRHVFTEDFKNHGDAIRSSVEWRDADCTTEILTLSDASLFDTAPDHYNADVDRIAY